LSSKEEAVPSSHPDRTRPNDSRSAAIPIRNDVLFFIKASIRIMPVGIVYITATRRFFPEAAKRHGIRGKGKGRDVPRREERGHIQGKERKKR
jgi:hypothetical protein